jgi:hypothetical protein
VLSLSGGLRKRSVNVKPIVLFREKHGRMNERKPMYHVTIARRQGKNTEYRTSGRVRIHSNYLELPLGEKTYYVELSGVKEIVETEIADGGEPGEIVT